eukprot:CAMPEP_0173351654 /NCGR_PEP_ID=MMETSP1144-20121109/15577_1 /TAXON_ID=483371 /ORGANISM="non described non described, Strain CCMP2298" /LENGTH=485 /DNA_ID=CAMNT_0014299771 /DNA_START=62 /DNA_END=1516 /DNA_ORIENTATION=-
MMHLPLLLLCLCICTAHTAADAPAFTVVRRAPVAVQESDPEYGNKPYIDGALFFHGGEVHPFLGPSLDMTSPIIDAATGERTVIGRLAQMGEPEVAQVLASAKAAWGRSGLEERRDEIVKVLMWEICKSTTDAAAEFDRTLTFIRQSIEAFRRIDADEGDWRSVGGILSKVRRAAIGIMLCLGPFNYPFNETYATLIPALLAGNVVIMKVPNLGGLAHVITMQVYAEHLPPGAINFFSGPGRSTMGPLMETGDIDVLAFIGGSSAADAVIKAHPHPHRLKVFLQLEGKNLGIVLPDADVDTAVQQVLVGSTSYNGQRCTAIKLVMLHRSQVPLFLPKFTAAVNNLIFGLPWEPKVQITPLPEPKKPTYLMELIADAVSKGAKVLNEGGGDLYGNLVRPAVVYPVTGDMRLWGEEQFGPVIPIAVYDDIEEVYRYIADTPYGQQASIFTTNTDSQAAALLDVLSTAVGRININTQCGRSPDSVPFS